jgi:hypothetical protein
MIHSSDVVGCRLSNEKVTGTIVRRARCGSAFGALRCWRFKTCPYHDSSVFYVGICTDLQEMKRQHSGAM